MRLLTPLLATSALVLVMAACSPKPAAEPAEAAPAEDAGIATEASTEAVNAGGGDTVAPPSGSDDAARDQDRPQGMPADPNRPMRPRGGDGPTTLSEMQTRSDRRFDRMDANSDGVITTDEMGDGDGRGARMMDRADANNDGRITRAEMQAGTQAMFRIMDANGDGKVTEEERPQF